VGGKSREELDYQKKLCDKIRDQFDVSRVIRPDPSRDPDIPQGFPDILILFKDGRWATLEAKKDAVAKHRPNQDRFVSTHNEAFFSRFIYPENEEEILSELQQALQS